ncbi:hypothetical protein [Pseudoalteromonas sp. SMS1]|nr:hypothetical protein [Pseudoalteromonas sp. SMS1]
MASVSLLLFVSDDGWQSHDGYLESMVVSEWVEYIAIFFAK